MSWRICFEYRVDAFPIPRNRAGKRKTRCIDTQSQKQICLRTSERRRRILTSDRFGVSKLPVSAQLDTIHANAAQQCLEQCRLADVDDGILASVDAAGRVMRGSAVR